MTQLKKIKYANNKTLLSGSVFRWLFHSRVGQAAWNLFCLIAKIDIVNKILQRALFLGCTKNTENVILPKLHIFHSVLNKSVIFIMPFYYVNASNHYSNQIALYVKSKGFNVIGVVYGNRQSEPDLNIFDEFYQVNPQHPDYCHIHSAAESVNIIDEWIGPEIIQFISGLQSLRDVDSVFINYVFLSKLFSYFPKHTKRILLTHDVFAYRNLKIKNAGLPDNSYYFSTDYENERKGLVRADVIFAIQSEEQKFFQSEYNLSNIEVLPYIPAKNYLPFRANSSQQCTIGYIGSNHPPNISAVTEFINKFDLNQIGEFIIAGTICKPIKNYRFPKKVRIVGLIDDLKTFYEQCDVVINPDVLESGLKIKSLEAFSFGKPLVCTATAHIGIVTKSKYHNAESVSSCTALALEVVKDELTRKKLAQESVVIFERFCEQYSIDSILDKHLNLPR